MCANDTIFSHTVSPEAEHCITRALGQRLRFHQRESTDGPVDRSDGAERMWLHNLACHCHMRAERLDVGSKSRLRRVAHESGGELQRLGRCLRRRGAQHTRLLPMIERVEAQREWG